MTPLKRRIVRLIEAAGPLPVGDYMALCLFDPQHGYYTTREPFGAGGDFTTAPEISQMFGELVAVWLLEAWAALGRPEDAIVAEIGPGRGTLMKDMARTLLRLAPDLSRRTTFALVETSPRLRRVQGEALDAFPLAFQWHETVATLPERPLLIVGNEIFDAVPLRQYVRSGEGWRERMVGLGADGELRFMAGAGGLEPALLPAGAEHAPEGAVAELAPARAALMEQIAGLIARRGGAGLFFDYGHAAPALGDTLQAVRRHRFDDVLAHPGEADLTAHVDFSALAATASRGGLAAHLMEQGDFLVGMGLLERAGRLGASGDETLRERLSGEAERLAGPEAMGRLFKVLAVTQDGLRLHPFPSASRLS